MQDKITISYAITTHNEGFYIKNLLERILKYIDSDDEIVVVDDYSDDPATLEILEKYKSKIKLVYHKLNGNFAEHKNFMNAQCSKGDIFNIDADEMPHDNLLLTLKEILQSNPNTDLFWVPRINIVPGIENRPDLIQQWGWRLDEKHRINAPDYQGRIYKRKPEILWSGKVHETITGNKTQTFLPSTVDDYCLLHLKQLETQIRQNSLYSEIEKNK